jgi:hypothetical protein
MERFSKDTPTSNFMKIRPMEAELVHADRQTDRQTDITKLVVAFRNFANAPKNEFLGVISYVRSRLATQVFWKVKNGWSCTSTPRMPSWRVTRKLHPTYK